MGGRGLRAHALRPYLPLAALALVAPSIPELLTGSTPITTLFVDPGFFLVQFAGLVALYGGGAILIREFCVAFGKGWASVLLLGAAYGIGEEGFAVHTFFEPSGAPVHSFGVYGSLFGVDWLWAFGLIVFHATYSIALPILLVGLWFPADGRRRWLGRPGLALTAAAYLAVVVLFAVVVGHGAGPASFALFLLVALALIALAGRVPGDFLDPRVGPSRVPAWVVAGAASLPFDVWTVVLLQSEHPVVPAVAAAALLGLSGIAALVVLLGYAGSERADWTKLHVAAGMLGALFAWDVVIEFSVPGILLVTAVFVGLLYQLRQRLRAREPRILESAPGGSRPVP